jgi:UDP-N-acetylmuramate--alanine ligase
MHVFFSGIGGTAIGPLAQIAYMADHTVSGSDKQQSAYVDYLRKHGIDDIHIGQTVEQIKKVHESSPIDWFVYSSAVAIEQPNSPELEYCRSQGIKTSKRDEFLNYVIEENNLKLIAVSGTHGKTTTAAMAVWLFKELGIPISYSVGAKLPFGDMGWFEPKSEYFVLEADEFDHNFLAFHPYLALITGIDYDHHEIYPTRQNYEHAFVKFIRQSAQTAIWKSDAAKLKIPPSRNMHILPEDKNGGKYSLLGSVNRLNARLVVEGLGEAGIVKTKQKKLIDVMNHFPGLSRRFEPIAENLYSDYAHTPEKIRGCLKTAFELSPNVVVVYEPLTNRRQHFIKNEYTDLFSGVKKLYWVPSYLAREDPSQQVLDPSDLIQHMDNKEAAEAALLDDHLAEAIRVHSASGDLVVCISGGGGGSLDEWLRKEFANG